MRDSASVSRRLGAWIAAWAALSLSCAVSVPPSGGPPDKTPPSVVGTVPSNDSVGVALDSRVQIAFSEDMTRTHIERLVSFSPDVVIDDVRWNDKSITVTPRDGLKPDTTYVVTLESGFRDNHSVESKTDYRFAFATSAHIDTGRVEGVVRFRREPTSRAIVRCFSLPVDSGFAPESARSDRRARSGESGQYTLNYLPTNDRSFLVWAFEDKNGNGSYDRDADVGLERPDTIRLAPDAPFAVGADLTIVDPDEPAIVRGRVVNESGVDTMLVSVGLYAAPDTLPSWYTVCDTSGRYEFSSIRAGRYVLRAFVDVVSDSLCGTYPCGPDSASTCEEPCVAHPDTVVALPGQVLNMTPVELAPARRERGRP